MKRAFSIIFVLCIILSLIPAAGAAGDPAVSLSKVKAAPGDDISVDIVLSDNPGINTCTFGVEYDSNVLTLNSVRAAEAVGGSFVFEKRGVWFSESDTSYSGTFFTLDFTVAKGAATGVYPVTVICGEGDISNSAEEDVAFRIIPGSVTVSFGSMYTLTIGGTATEYAAGETVNISAETFYTANHLYYRFTGWSGDTDVLSDATQAEISFTMPEKDIVLEKEYLIIGDFNGDGDVNAIDLNLMRRALIGLYNKTASMDINKDDNLNAVDLNLFRRMLIGLYAPTK